MIKGKPLVAYRSHSEDRARLRALASDDLTSPPVPVRTKPVERAVRALGEQDYGDAAASLDCDVAALKAVAQVESCGSGFLRDGRLKVLFEGHVFYRYTKGAFAETNPTLCHAKWTTANYCSGDAETRGQWELFRLEQAKKLDRKAALMSCSIGRFQVMGFNFALCGFRTVEEFWASLASGEQAHLGAFCAYVQAVGITKVLKNHDWAEFARVYNGPEYSKNQYDLKLARAYSALSQGRAPAA
jgi:hypothetical protein